MPLLRHANLPVFLRLKIITLACVFTGGWFATAIHAQTTLQLGANVNESLTRLEPALLDRSHTTWVRGFLPASQFITGQRSLATDPGIKTLQQCARDGRKVIVTIKWDLKEADWRVPAPDSATEKKWFAWVDELLGTMRGQISIFALINEVFIDTPPADLEADAQGRIPMVTFLQRLAAHVAASQPKAADGRALPLYCGGFTRLDTVKMQKHPATLALLRWINTDARLAGVNFHLHQRNFDEFQRALQFLRRHIPAKPAIVTEFSFVSNYREHLNDPLANSPTARAFATRLKLAPNLTVREYINRCIANPVSEIEWNEFLGTQPWFDPEFLKRAGDLMQRHGGVVATYAFSQKSSAGNRPLAADATPWLLNAIYIPGTACAADPVQTAVNLPWFREYLRRQNAAPTTSTATTQFTNPIAAGQDPWVVRDPNGKRFLWTQAHNGKPVESIAIYESDSLATMGRRHVVWRAPQTGPFSREVWAPELHFLDGRWHIYFAADDGQNKNHLAYVLAAKTADPLGEYELHGPLATGDGADGRSPNIWAIDMTVMELQGRRYAVWSGWDAPGTDSQHLYIAPMKSPGELAGPRVRLCDNSDFKWEFTGQPGKQNRGLNEGPEALQRGGRTFIVFSCGIACLPTYKLGLLEFTGGDPLSPASWHKHPQPVFSSTEKTFGVGHSCFVPSPDSAEWWHVFHAKRERGYGWERDIFVQPLRFDERGFPDFGKPVAADRSR